VATPHAGFTLAWLWKYCVLILAFFSGGLGFMNEDFFDGIPADGRCTKVMGRLGCYVN
jgi:hypothetical protein